MKQPETISLEKLGVLAKGNGTVAVAARKALIRANALSERGCLASILLDRHLKHIQVYAT